MTATKITAEEIEDLKVSSLPTHPTAPTAYGGKGYTAREMKEAFDKLPLFIIERFNALINDVKREGDGSLASSMPSGIRSNHTLADLLSDIKSGGLAAYLAVGNSSLEAKLAENESTLEAMRVDIEDMKSILLAKLEEHEALLAKLEEHETRITACESERSEENE